MKGPFFIIGSGRCGSTYLYSLLQEHPYIALTNEAHVLDFLWFCSEFASVPTYAKRTFTLHAELELHGMVNLDCIPAFRDVLGRHIKPIVEEFYREQFPGKGFRRWGDKLPDPRAALAARDLWPDSDYLVLVRDPRDVLCSFRKFADTPAGSSTNDQLPEWGKRSAKDFCIEFRTLYHHGLQYAPEHLLIRYEDLVLTPNVELERILTHLGLDPDRVPGDDVTRPELFAQHATSSTAQESIGRWRTDLPPDDAAYLERELGDLLTRFGYA